MLPLTPSSLIPKVRLLSFLYSTLGADVAGSGGGTRSRARGRESPGRSPARAWPGTSAGRGLGEQLCGLAEHLAFGIPGFMFDMCYLLM